MGTKLTKKSIQALFDEICEKVNVDAKLKWNNRKSYRYNENNVEVNILGQCKDDEVRIFINSIDWVFRRTGLHRESYFETNDKITMTKLVILHELAHAEIHNDVKIIHNLTCDRFDKLKELYDEFNTIYQNAINRMSKIKNTEQSSDNIDIKLLCNDLEVDIDALKNKQQIIEEEKESINFSLDEGKELSEDNTNHDLMFEVYMDNLVDNYILAGGTLNMNDSRGYNPYE